MGAHRLVALFTRGGNTFYQAFEPLSPRASAVLTRTCTKRRSGASPSGPSAPSGASPAHSGGLTPHLAIPSRSRGPYMIIHAAGAHRNKRLTGSAASALALPNTLILVTVQALHFGHAWETIANQFCSPCCACQHLSQAAALQRPVAYFCARHRPPARPIARASCALSDREHWSHLSHNVTNRTQAGKAFQTTWLSLAKPAWHPGL